MTSIPGFYISTAKEKLNLPWVCARIRGSYWGGWLTDEQIVKACERSLCFGAYAADQVFDGGEIAITGEQVGFARVVTDGATFSSLMDVIVEERLRGQGLGSRLVDAVLKHPDVRGTINIISTEDRGMFYENRGWSPCEGVMKRNPA